MTAMLAAGRITARLHRFELVAFGALAVLGVVATVVIAAQLEAVGWTAACDEAMRRGGSIARECEFKVNEFYGIASSRGWIVTGLTGFVPLLAALLIGVAVVGREIERGTTRLAWALTPSRLRWLGQRLVPVLLFVALVGLVLGAAADRWLAASEPGLDPANAFAAFGFRGPVLAARAVFVLSLALVIGALLGRPLPALIVAGVVAAVGLAGGSEVHQRILRTEAVAIDESAMDPGDLWIDQQFRLPDGTLVGWDEVERYDPPPAEFEPDGLADAAPRDDRRARASLRRGRPARDRGAGWWVARRVGGHRRRRRAAPAGVSRGPASMSGPSRLVASRDRPRRCRSSRPASGPRPRTGSLRRTAPNRASTPVRSAARRSRANAPRPVGSAGRRAIVSGRGRPLRPWASWLTRSGELDRRGSCRLSSSHA